MQENERKRTVITGSEPRYHLEDGRGSRRGFRGKSRQKSRPGVPVFLRGHKFY